MPNYDKISAIEHYKRSKVWVKRKCLRPFNGLREWKETMN
jgi:hypothetical protein